ncbi:hypothetical protein C8R43DRAFT_943979 [Mycena crocata]|nr:hypothetical protein C8R43DRAFT_943979 [Mycena crocata]
MSLPSCAHLRFLCHEVIVLSVSDNNVIPPPPTPSQQSFNTDFVDLCSSDDELPAPGEPNFFSGLTQAKPKRSSSFAAPFSRQPWHHYFPYYTSYRLPLSITTKMLLDLCVELLQEIGRNVHGVSPVTSKIHWTEGSFLGNQANIAINGSPVMAGEYFFTFLSLLGPENSFVTITQARWFISQASVTRHLNLWSSTAQTMKSNQLHMQETVTALGTIAKGKTGWSYYAKTLIIKPGKRARGGSRHVHHLLAVAVSAALEFLKNIRAVSALNQLPFLEDPQLGWWPTGNISHNFPVTVLSGLHGLTARSRYQNPTLGADQLCSLMQQSRGLTSLHLLGGEAAWWPEVWTMLCEQSGLNIRLIDICTDVVTSNLLTYLESYLFWAGESADLLQQLETLELCVNAVEVLNIVPADNAIVWTQSHLILSHLPIYN